MKTLLSRSIPLVAFLSFAGCASLPAQDPVPFRGESYSTEELDNLVAPVALYPDALLAQILVAATFPDQIALAQRYVRERGTRNIDEQGWDISVKAVAYYPPVLNMLATQEDWSVALGQAYAAQSGDIMDAVQRLREMAREQGNLVSTKEHTVTEDRGRIVIVPANPQVIYVPTYDPAIVYVRPVWSFGFHTGYFSFGLGYPIGSWLVYEPDWWGHYGHRVYYHGWYGDGWRYYARRHFAVIPVYHRPRYSIVHFNINIFGRRVNYINLDRRHRYVRRTVVYERHYRNDRDRSADRDRWDRDNGRWDRDNDDRRGPVGNPRGGDNRQGNDNGRGPSGDNNGRGDGNGGRRGGGNDRIGDRIATFDDYRPDRGGNGSDSREAEPPVRSSGSFDNYDRNGSTRSNSGAETRARPDVPVFTSPRSSDRKADANARPQPEVRGSRPNVPVYTSPRSTERKSKDNAGSQAESRGSRPNAPVFTAPPRVERTKPSGNNGRSQSEIRREPGPNATFSAPQRSSKSGGGSVQSNRPAPRSAPSVSRPPSGGGKVKPSGGSSNKGGGGKGRKQ